MNKQQVIFVSGGNPKENYSDYYDYIRKLKFDPTKQKIENYNKTLGKYLGDKYEYIRLDMPEKKFADYEAWKIYFEKIIPYLQEDCIIATTSLGSTFIVKYLQENNLDVSIKKLFLIAPAIEDTPTEVLGTFTLKSFNFDQLERQCKDIYLYHSTDDTYVPISNTEILKENITGAHMRIFHDKWHFYLEERLIELEQDIKA